MKTFDQLSDLNPPVKYIQRFRISRKSQISSTKFQMVRQANHLEQRRKVNLKFQYPNVSNRFGILNFVHWDLFVIWNFQPRMNRFFVWSNWPVFKVGG
jgi:hypothetical protein